MRKPAKQRIARDHEGKTCSVGSTLGAAFVVVSVMSFSLFDSKQSQEPILSPDIEMKDPNIGPMYAMTTQDEWCASIVNYYEPPEQSRLWPLMANTSLMTKAGTYNHKHLSLYPELVIRELNSTKKEVLVICVTQPTVLLIVDFKKSITLLSKMNKSCELT